MTMGLSRLALAVMVAGILPAKALAEDLPAGNGTPAVLDPDAPAALPGMLVRDSLKGLGAPLEWDGGAWGSFAWKSLAVLGTAMALDRPVRDAMDRNQRHALDRGADRTASLGVAASMAAAGGFYGIGLWRGDAQAKATGADALTASLLSGVLIVPALKAVAGRARPGTGHGPFFLKPFSQADAGFPSGHTVQVFAVAAVITEHYPQPWVQWAAYGGAGLTGLSRLVGRHHYASDVLAGAFIGLGVGKGVVRMNREHRFGKRGSFQVSPMLGGDGSQGIQARLVF